MVLVPVLLWPALPTGTGPLGEQLQRTLRYVGMMWHLWALSLGFDERDSSWELGPGQRLQPSLRTSCKTYFLQNRVFWETREERGAGGSREVELCVWVLHRHYQLLLGCCTPGHTSGTVGLNPGVCWRSGTLPRPRLARCPQGG